jgi:hypothetical protein
MSPVRKSFVVAPAAAALLWASLAPALSAQTEGAWLCRLRWQEQTYGGDTLATTAVFQLQRAAPDGDGGVVYMGQGRADIVFAPGGGCTATRGGNASVTMMAIVSSDDGETATVDIGAFMQDRFPVAVSCPYAHNSEMDVAVSSPPNITLRLEDGASANYDSSSVHSWGAVGGQRGEVTLEYCRPEHN